MSCRVNFHVVRSALQYSACRISCVYIIIIFADQVFIDPTFFGIFVCGPLQSFEVNFCIIRNMVLNQIGYKFLQRNRGAPCSFLQSLSIVIKGQGQG